MRYDSLWSGIGVLAGKKMSGVSAVIVSYFTGPLLARSIASLKAQPEISEIFVVDNGNWDGAVDDAVAATQGGTPVHVITGHGNVGFATACNLGAKRAKGEFLLFLNPDAMMPSGGVATFLEDAKDLQRPWMIGPKLVDPDGGEQQGSRRATLTPWRAFVEATSLYRFAPRHPYFRRFNLHNEPCPQKLCKLPTISGACFFLPREDYFSVGGMDERYFLHVEDVDFCLRFTNAGGSIYFSPTVCVAHFKSSSRVSPLRVERRKTTSMLRYFRQHFTLDYPAPFLWLVWCAVWAAFVLRVAKSVVTGAVALIGLGPSGGDTRRRARQLAARRSLR